MAEKKNTHIRSYKQIEELFFMKYPMLAKQVVNIERMAFKPKSGAIGVELKNGLAILFMASSYVNDKKEVDYDFVGIIFPFTIEGLDDCSKFLRKH